MSNGDPRDPRSATPEPVRPCATRPPGSRTRRVLWVAAAIVVALGLGFVALVFTVVTQMQTTSWRYDCMSNLQNLAELCASVAIDGPGRRDGVAMFLEWRKTDTRIRRGQEQILLCPADPDVRRPVGSEDREAWDTVDLDHPPRALCSYAARDFTRFPVTPAELPGAPIAACPHHGSDGVLVAFGDASVRFVERGALGLPDGAPITFGPDSPSPILRVLVLGEETRR